MSCSRRQALAALTSVGTLAFLAACASDATTSPDVPDAVMVTASQVVVRLDLLDALRTADSAYVLGKLNLIVLRLTGDDYRVFTNICTHAGCGISLFEGQRMKCPCHGSEFDINGRNVLGPAPLPLQQFASTFDASSRTLRIERRA